MATPDRPLPTAAPTLTRRPSWPRAVIALTALAFSVLPVWLWLRASPDMLLGSESGDAMLKSYMSTQSEWLSGASIVLGGGVVLSILSRRLTWLWRDGLGASLGRIPLSETRVSLMAALLALPLYAGISLFIFEGRPNIIDELTLIWQAQQLVQGRLWVPTTELPEFFSSMLVVNDGPRTYGQYPAGATLLLALGFLLNAPWLIGPLCGAITVGLWHRTLTVIREPRPIAVGATAIFALAPMTAFIAGTYLNHVPVLMFLMLGMLGMAAIVSGRRTDWLAGAAVGLGFGCAATIRVVEAISFAVPAAIVLVIFVMRRRIPLATLLASGIAIAVPLAGLLLSNELTTGHPLLFAYEVQWGREHGLGFRDEVPWGVPHTPWRGLALTNLYLLRFQNFLFELPVPSLLPPIVALVFWRRMSEFDRYLLIAASLLVGFYFAYWFDGYWLGPRFYHPLIPIAALWAARFPGVVRERFGTTVAYRPIIYGSVVAVTLAFTVSIPYRASNYRNMMFSLRWDADAAAERAGVRNAVVFVRETWGSQLIARMWTLDVPRSRVERLYRYVDACMLEEEITALERSNTRGSQATLTLELLLVDSARVKESPYSPDVSERYLPGTRYTQRCMDRIMDDRNGTTPLPPKLIAWRHDNIFARDLHERNARLLALYPDRPVYLLKPDSVGIQVPPRFIPLSRDSLANAWGTSPSHRDSHLLSRSDD